MNFLPTTHRPACRLTCHLGHAQSGVSLLETLAAILVLATIAFLAVSPSQAYFSRSTLDVSLERLLSDIRLARSEARLLGNVVYLCQSNDLARCNTSKEQKWENGWLAFVDHNQNRRQDATETPILSGHANKQLQISFNNLHPRLFISELGTIRSSGNFQITHTASGKNRKIITHRSGRLRVE